MTHERIQKEMLSIADFWRGLEALRVPGDLYETMRLYDARANRVIVLIEPKRRYWTFYVEGQPEEVFSESVQYLCRMPEER